MQLPITSTARRQAGVPATLAKQPVLPSLPHLHSGRHHSSSFGRSISLLPPHQSSIQPVNSISKHVPNPSISVPYTAVMMINVTPWINTHFLTLNVTSEFDHSLNNNKKMYCALDTSNNVRNSSRNNARVDLYTAPPPQGS